MEQVKIFYGVTGEVQESINDWIIDKHPQITRVLQSGDDHGYLYISIFYSDVVELDVSDFSTNDANKAVLQNLLDKINKNKGPQGPHDI